MGFDRLQIFSSLNQTLAGGILGFAGVVAFGYRDLKIAGKLQLSGFKIVLSDFKRDRRTLDGGGFTPTGKERLRSA